MKRTLLLLCCGLLYLTLSGFQCASTQISTAKVALKNKDFAKAEESLKAEVAARPGNAEAWYLLGSSVYYPQQRWDEMNDAFEKSFSASEPPLDSKDKSDASVFMLRPAIQAGVFAARAAQGNQFAEAVLHIDTAIWIRPEIANNYSQKAYYHSRLDQNEQMISTYRNYAEMFSPDITKGVNEGLALDMTDEAVKAKLGKPNSQTPPDKETGRYALVYPDGLYVYMIKAEEGSANVVEGWKYFDNMTFPEEFKSFGRPLNGYPFYRLGVEAYGDKNYDDALEYLRTVERFDPNREDVGNLIAQVYIDADRIDEARGILEQRMKDEPNNPKVYINYSILLHNAKNYKGATEILARVLDLDLPETNESFQTALYNLGVFYKNWGKHLQDSLDEATNSKPSEAQQQQFIGKLSESVKAFERLRSIQKDAVDYSLLAELGNLYYVLGQDDKLQGILTQFEAMKNSEAVQEDGQYWRELSKLHAALGNVEEAAEASKKAKMYGY